MAVLAFLIALLLSSGAQFQSSSAGPLAGSAACRSCHADVYAKWSDSIHGRMIQRANRNSVVANIDMSGGPGTIKAWRGGTLYITENGIDNRVDYTLGNRRIQHYLTARANGEIDVLRTTWDVKRQEWFDSKEIVQSAPADFVQQWNTFCFYCHVTQQEQDVKGFDPKTFEYKTNWVESSATCERCHGPMAAHATAESSDDSSYLPSKPPTAFDNLMRCGQCHWPKNVVATGFNTRKQYFDFYTPGFMHLDPDEDGPDSSWWVDGRPRRFSTEAAGFFLSGCFQSGKATCMSCHDPHWNRTDGNDALMSRADQYCEECHDGLRRETHTHHDAASAGSSCVACHMPHSVRGVKATMRDHSLSFPEPQNTVRYGVPNACNECHSDHTAEWALEKVDTWYPGRSIRPQLRASAFALARKGDARSVNSLVRLAGDFSENAAIRATATGYLGRFQTDLAAKTLIALTHDKQPMVRLEAARVLGGFPSVASALALGSLLDDAYRAVRIYAAASLTSPLFPRLDFSAAAQRSFESAIGEFRTSLEIEGDHPMVQIRLGGLEFTQGHITEAREAYRRALKLNPGEADAYIGLAIIDLQTGNRGEALKNAHRATQLSNKDIYRKFLEKIRSAN